MEELSRLIHDERHYTHRIGWLRAAVWGRTMASSPLRRWSSVSRPRRALAAQFSSLGWPDWLPEQCRWRLVNTSPSARRRTRNEPTWRVRLVSSPSRRSGAPRASEHLCLPRPRCDLALRVAEQLSAGIGWCSRRDELGITEAKPRNQFRRRLHRRRHSRLAPPSARHLGAGRPTRLIIALVTIASLISLAGLGALAAGAGGAGRWRGAIRVTFWSALAMALTALVGRMFGATA